MGGLSAAALYPRCADPLHARPRQPQRWAWVPVRTRDEICWASAIVVGRRRRSRRLCGCASPRRKPHGDMSRRRACWTVRAKPGDYVVALSAATDGAHGASRVDLSVGPIPDKSPPSLAPDGRGGTAFAWARDPTTRQAPTRRSTRWSPLTGCTTAVQVDASTRPLRARCRCCRPRWQRLRLLVRLPRSQTRIPS